MIINCEIQSSSYILMLVLYISCIVFSLIWHQLYLICFLTNSYNSSMSLSPSSFDWAQYNNLTTFSHYQFIDVLIDYLLAWKNLYPCSIWLYHIYQVPLSVHCHPFVHWPPFWKDFFKIWDNIIIVKLFSCTHNHLLNMPLMLVTFFSL